MKKPNHAEIIQRVEARLYAHIVDTSVCLEGCKCEVCFQKYLDNVVTASNAVTPEYLPEPLQIEHFI